MVKKKSGSTLITVLALAIVVMTVALAIITSIMGTTKINSEQKIREDLRYAAESGIEIARGHLEGKSSITQDDIKKINDKLKNTLVDANNDNLPDSNIGSVEVVSPIVDESGNIIDASRKKPEKPGGGNKKEFKLEVRATKLDEESIHEDVSVRYLQGGGSASNIFDYGIVAGEGDITVSNPTLNDFQVDVSAGDKVNINGVDKSGDKYHTGNIFEQLKFVENTEFTEKITLTKINEKLYPKLEYKDMYVDEEKNNLNGFGFYDIKNKKKLQITEVEIDLKQQGIQKAYIDGKEIQGDVKIGLKEAKKKSIIRVKVNNEPSGMTLLIFNSNNLEILPIEPNILLQSEPKIIDGELNLEIYQGQTLALSNYVVLNMGSVNIKGNSTLSTYNTTIYGASVNVNKNASMHVATVSGTEGHGINKNDEGKFNEILSMFIENWNKDDGLSTGKITMKENTFDN